MRHTIEGRSATGTDARHDTRGDATMQEQRVELVLGASELGSTMGLGRAQAQISELLEQRRLQPWREAGEQRQTFLIGATPAR